MINWDDIRKQFPVTNHSTYLNAAAAGPLSRTTCEVATHYYRQMMDDGDVHWEEWLAKRDDVRKKVAAFINADPREIAFTTNTSSGMNIIIDALETQGEVISCDLEFPVSTLPWMNRRIPVHLVRSVDGQVGVDNIRSAMNARTGTICLSHVQFSNGLRMDLEEIGNAKGEHAFVVNGSQSAGVFEIDVKRMKIDALCATGHKWMLSGYGSGFVYLSSELLERSRPRAIGWLSVHKPFSMRNAEIHLRGDAGARSELGCPHFAGIFALGASLDLMREIGIRNIEERALWLNRLLTDKVTEAGCTVLSPIRDEKMRSAETLVEVQNQSVVVAELRKEKIIVTEKPQGIRIATDFFNNEEDIGQLVRALGKCRREASLG
ncbi:MAG: aminotransferase class V-fold PLP-dependent enzyme [Pyrinomonadaceae bacterium]